MKPEFAKIELLLLDVDGVLTDGSITYSDSGEQIKQFHSRDGLGLRLLMDAGIRVGIITGRKSGALVHRCKNLGIQLLYDGITDKSNALDTICRQTGIDVKKMAFAGDDLIDLPVMKRVGISFSVSDAAEEVKAHADLVTGREGGHGAVREMCEIILKSKGVWDTILEKYLS